MGVMQGHLKVYKKYDDSISLIHEDSNIITEGFGIVVTELFSIRGSTDSIDFIPSYFQIGTDIIGFSGVGSIEPSANFYKLSAAITDSQYGECTNLRLFKANRSLLVSTDGTNSLGEVLFSAMVTASSQVSATPTEEWFAGIENELTTKYYIDSVSYRLILDKETCNGLTIKEIGLYSRNPAGKKKDNPLLVAYKRFHPGLVKANSYELIFDWQVGFVRDFTTFDNRISNLGSGLPTDRWYLS